MRQILLNQIMTPDGTILTSNHRHDYVTYQDKNGLRYMVDGGDNYLRRTVHSIFTKNKFLSFINLIAKIFGCELKDPLAYTELSIFSDDSIDKIRLHVCRGGRGKDGKQPLTWVKLCDMSTSWVQACVEYENKHRPENIMINVYKRELAYRFKNDIFIADK